MLFAFAMQIDANFINDFYDFVNGTDDAETRLGPRRACAQGWVTLDAMKKAIALTTCLACVIGLPLALYGGLEMIAVGVACVVFAFLYTTFFSYQGLSGPGRLAGAGVLRSDPRLLHVLYPTAHHDVGGVSGFDGLWPGDRCPADRE